MKYLIPKSAVVFEEEIKKSRFITYLKNTEGMDQAKSFWQEIRTLHPNARHHCWATVAGAPSDSQLLGFSDDKEPAGTAGRPILNALLGSQIGEVSAVVVRYYGGILLGTGGLARAYSNGVQQALRLLETEIKIKRESYILVCDYEQIGWVQHLCSQHSVLIYSQNFQEKVQFQLGLSSEQKSIFIQELIERSAGQLTLDIAK